MSIKVERSEAVRGCELFGDRRLLHTFTDKALDVEVFVLDPKRLPLAGLPTVLTGDRSSSSALLLLLLLLLQRAVDSLLLKHCRRQRVDFRSYLSTHKKIHGRYRRTQTVMRTGKEICCSTTHRTFFNLFIDTHVAQYEYMDYLAAQ